MSKHTATPWVATDNKSSTTIRAMGDHPKPIAEIWDNGDDRMANAEFIVRAVNAHDELIKALRLAEIELSAVENGSTGGIPNSVIALIPEALEAVRSALAKHGGAS